MRARCAGSKKQLAGASSATLGPTLHVIHSSIDACQGLGGRLAGGRKSGGELVASQWGQVVLRATTLDVRKLFESV